MVHGPCGMANPKCPCMKEGRCTKYFPKKFQDITIVDQEGYLVYRRRDNRHIIEKNGIMLHSGHVVPHNPHLLMKYEAHTNMEWCNQSTSIEYLFKYINKGSDKILTVIIPNATGGDGNIDEIKQYLDCRYASPSEACWRIFSYSIHGRKPTVERLFFYMEGENSVYYKDFEQIGNVLLKESVTESMFTSWFMANRDYDEAKLLTYGQFVSKFVYDKKKRCWKPRKRGYTIGRFIWVPPSTGELYYMQMLLNVKKGPTSYDDLKTVEGFKNSTFRELCFAMGFLQDDREFIEAIKEAYNWGSSVFLRKLFVTMLLSASINRLEHVWRNTWRYLSDGILYEQRLLSKNPELSLSDEEIKELTLIEFEKHLKKNKRILNEFKPMPYPDNFVLDFLGNRLIYDERQYDISAQKELFDSMFQALTDIISTKLINIFYFYEQGIASLLLPGGKTTHSRFKIPVPCLESSICYIEKKIDLAGLLKVTNLIIWDEAPMANKFCFEALDKSLKDIMDDDKVASKIIFGGKVVVFGGDFRQILPVVPRGTRSDIVHSTINASYIWDHYKVLKLTKNARLRAGTNPTNAAKIHWFSEWILQFGDCNTCLSQFILKYGGKILGYDKDGKISEPNAGYAEICIPHELLLAKFDDPIEMIVKSTYPNILENYTNSTFLQSRAILASTIEIVDEINDYIINLLPGDAKEFLSSDSIDRS
ncbi:uncharacterized protein LOC131613479 [Vicia villosa]|uniref:uncharacterized protein LOC131613479 n=1 Tax=Vicia villosa TaxID=3911 RepID=UPI00273C9F3B|nr:uncharacterized protein LOC131613479 [Vicia villosa]